MSQQDVWNITTTSPMGSQDGSLELTTEGNVLSGTMSGPDGSLTLSEGSVEGNNLSWKAQVTTPMPVTLECKGTIEGDTISGEFKVGAFGTATFSGSRA